MIVVRLRGGFGNQMYEYAAGRALADRLGTDLGFHAWVVSDALSAVFNLRLVAPDRHLPAAEKTLLRRALKWRPGGFRIYREPRDGRFDPRVLSLPDNTYLQGFLQHERYFADHVEAIRRDFTFTHEPDAQNAEWLARIRSEPHPVSVHVRRGDFREIGYAPVEYYREAMDRIPASRFFIFSDEPDWCRANLPMGTIIDHNADKPHEDLRLISACADHIGTPKSSFSFWGAWLQLKVR